ncbi:MAG: ferrous iron transport protein B [Promethearchaeota archaeon]
MSEQTIALIGNPNVGKTVVFNTLTGSRAHVANWPGVTVEKKTGKMDGITVVDLPGVYSLTATAIDDLIARNYILDESPQLVIDILDATNLERNLYLGLLLKEINVPVIFVLNMMDIVREKKISIDIKKLKEYLKSPVITTAAINDEGISNLKKIIKQHLKSTSSKDDQILYPKEIENRIKQIQDILTKDDQFQNEKNSRWISIKIMEKDEKVFEKFEAIPDGKKILSEVSGFAKEDDRILFASARYSYISEIIKNCFESPKNHFSSSGFLDQFFLDKYLGIPIFLAIMWAMFQFTFQVAAPFMSLIELIQEGLGALTINILGESLLSSFLVDGIINGFGSIIIFLPNIFLMFLALSFLEDSGYLSRAAFVMDRLMYKLGLHGRSFVSLILGFGCNIPAIMSTRSIESEKDRLVTIMVNQNISCSARLPVYILLAGAVWGQSAGGIVFSLYLLGIIIAILIALILQKFVLKSERSPFILELGDYRAPTAKYTIIHMWERGREFLKKAGKIILVTVIILWTLQTFPLGCAPDESYLYTFGKFIQPIFNPLHFGVIAVIGIIFGFIAKEVVISAFALMIGVSESISTLGATIFLQFGSSPVIAYSFLVFILLYTPCVAAIGAVYQETGSKKWTAISALYGFGLAYFMAFLVQLIGGVYF